MIWREARTVDAFSYERFRDSPRNMAYTGLPDGDAFETLCTFLEVSNENLVSNRQVRGEERHRSSDGGAKKGSTIYLKEQFLTLVRLRSGVDEEMPADLLHIAQSTVSRLLVTWVNFLYLRLSTIPIWPSPDTVGQNLSSSFKSAYPSTYIIIDCSELCFEAPSSLPLQSEMYSLYKSHTTLKGLVGIRRSQLHFRAVHW